MKKLKYMDEILKRIDDNSPVKCEDCGAISAITHAIVNHQYNDVKIVCDNCFRKKYANFLYSEERT